MLLNTAHRNCLKDNNPHPTSKGEMEDVFTGKEEYELHPFLLMQKDAMQCLASGFVEAMNYFNSEAFLGGNHQESLRLPP